MRNGTFIQNMGFEFELTQNPNNEFMLVFRGKNPPDNSFFLAHNCLNVYNRIIEREKISNAYSITNRAIFMGFNFQVDRFENQKYRLSTSDINAFKKLKLHMVDRGWYDIEVSPEQIEKMWEERKPSGYGFPFPEGLKEIEEIKF